MIASQDALFVELLELLDLPKNSTKSFSIHFEVGQPVMVRSKSFASRLGIEKLKEVLTAMELVWRKEKTVDADPDEPCLNKTTIK